MTKLVNMPLLANFDIEIYGVCYGDELEQALRAVNLGRRCMHFPDYVAGTGRIP